MTRTFKALLATGGAACALGLAHPALATTTQIQGSPQSAGCPSTTAPAVINGAVPVATDAYGNLCGGSSGGAVYGQTPAGSAATKPPVQVGGVDSGGAVRSLFTDSLGNLYTLGVDKPPEASRVTCTGATYNAATGVISWTASSQYCVVDTAGYPGGLSFQLVPAGGVAMSVTSGDQMANPNSATGCDNVTNMGASAPVSALNVAGELVCGRPHGRYIQLTSSAYVSGTPTAYLELRSTGPVSNAVAATILSGTNNIGFLSTLNTGAGALETSTALGSNATATGAGHVAFIGYATTPWTRFGCQSASDQTGTLAIDVSDNGGSSWSNVQSMATTLQTAVVAAAAYTADLSVPVRGNVGTNQLQYRGSYKNGAAAQATFRLACTYTSGN